MAKELVETEAGARLDAAKEQEDIDCEEEGVHYDPEFMVKDPEGLEANETQKKDSTYKKIELYSDNEIEKMTLNLDAEQRLVLDIAVDYACEVKKLLQMAQ